MRYSDWEQRQMDIKSGEELDRHAERKAVKVDISKEWCMNMAKLEEGQEIGAGRENHLLQIDAFQIGWLRQSMVYAEERLSSAVRHKDWNAAAEIVEYLRTSRERAEDEAKKSVQPQAQGGE